MDFQISTELANRQEIDSSRENLEGFLELAKWHDKSVTWPSRVIDDFEGHLPEVENGLILDAGCSYGGTTYSLADHYKTSRVIGMDNKGNKLPEASRSPRVEFRQGNFYLLFRQFSPETFDAIFATNNLTHVACELSLLEHTLIADNFNIVLKEGGYLCIAGIGALAVLRKKGSGFEEVIVNRLFRIQNDFGSLPEVYGVKCWYEGT